LHGNSPCAPPPGDPDEAIVGGWIMTAAATVRDALTRFLSSPFFFCVLGCGFMAASYRLLTQVGPCAEQQQSQQTSCLQLSQLNLAFGLMTVVLGVGLLIYGVALHATHQGQISSVKAVYNQIKLFFSSPIFFIMLGSFFIYCGLILLDQTHSGFVFILAVLGIAMILFGTGSQAMASGSLPDTGSTKVSVGIAGGAAALAAIFGYGIVYQETGIQNFFRRSVDYGYLELTTHGTSNQTVDFESQSISASTADGRPLPLWKQTGLMQIMVPLYSRQDKTTVVLTIKGSQLASNLPPIKFDVDWQKLKPLSAFGNDLIYIDQQKLTMPLAPTASLQVNDNGQPLPAVALPPPQ
jgi:hypothetical protein